MRTFSLPNSARTKRERLRTSTDPKFSLKCVPQIIRVDISVYHTVTASSFVYFACVTLLFTTMATSELQLPIDTSDTNKENQNPTSITKTKPSKPKNTPPKRAVFSGDDDRIMVDTLMEQKDEGHATDNGGWREPAINAVVKALKDSELQSGGVAKTAKSVRDHWGHVCMMVSYKIVLTFQQLKIKYNDLKTLASISGWGWDSENNRVQASDEQWDTYLQVRIDFLTYVFIAYIAF